MRCRAAQVDAACSAASQMLFGTDCICPTVDKQRECQEQAQETQNSLIEQQSALTVADFVNYSQYRLEHNRLSAAHRDVYTPCYDLPDDDCQVAMPTAHGTRHTTPHHATRGMHTGHRAQWHHGM